MAHVKIRYWAAAKLAAGMDAELINGDTLADVCVGAAARRGNDRRFVETLARSSFLIDGKQTRREAAAETRLWDDAVIEVLPPFAGG